MPDGLIPTKDPALLTARCKAVWLAASELCEFMVADLPDARAAEIGRMLGGGGRIGIEATVDGKSRHTLQLVGHEREGQRVVFATVRTAEPTAGNA